MSDGQADEQPPASAVASAVASKFKWGDPISSGRQAELQEYLDRWQQESDHGERKGPFDGRTLSGADVFWLAKQSEHDRLERVPNLHLEHADLYRAQLSFAHLGKAHLQGARLYRAYLKGAFLGEANLERTDLRETNLQGASLRQANLQGARLTGANLEGADVDLANLTGSSLRGASFDKASRLNNAVFSGAFFDQVRFDNTNLSVVDWSRVTTLGDERIARIDKDADGRPKTRDQRLEERKAAVRANRILAVDLHAQGLAEDAARFAYQAQVLQRGVLRLQRKPSAYLFSLLLAMLAGYGYRLRRIVVVYGLAVLLFAAGYFLAGGVTGPTQPQIHLSLQQQLLDALQLSLNAIHGRVFFTQFGLDTLQSWLATVESVVGIVIEGVFVAMLIQRFFIR